MRKYISYLMLAVAAAFFTGCIDVNVTPIEPQEPTMVTLQLRNADLVATRAITDDNLNNEDLIKSVQCFFAVAGSDAVVYATDLIPVNTQQTKTLSLAIPAESLSTLFANNATQCDVYVLANYGTKITDNSIATIKAKDITLGTGATQESFVMDGTAKVTLNGTALYGKVELKRAAAKIVVKANIKTSITEGSVTWTPNIAGIQMSYFGSVKGSQISADPAVAVITEKDTNPYTQTTGVFEGTTTEQLYVGYQKVPFYSFPVEASANKGEIDITIPWNPGNGDDVLYKYQVPVDIALERNHVYLIEVIVDVLGNTEGATLTPSYVVVNWTENPITTGLSRPKYLVVDETEVILNNVETYSVGFKASDEVVITEVGNHTFQSIYSSTKNTWDAVYSFSVANNITAANGAITFAHQLDNTTAAGTDDPAGRYDYQENTVTIRVSLKNDSSIYEDIKFVQRPAMFVDETASPGKVFINKNTNGGSGSSNWWYNNNGVGPNMTGQLYTITVSAFDATTAGYVITDPRMPAERDSNGDYTDFTFYTINGYGENSTKVDTAGDDTDSKDNNLTGYRPTISGEASANLVAPSFIIASGYGAYDGRNTNLYSETSAKYRCAAYQEAGYPAGRWRLPTPAELEVVGKLCSEGKLSSIFYGENGGYTYVSSNGIYRYRSGSFTKETENASRSVRCVYDIWYWKDKCANNNQFIWGAEGDIANGAKSNYLVSVE